MNAAILFGTTFVLVFALGVNTLSVNRDQYGIAFLTSFLISGSNLVILRTVPQGDLLEVAAYMLGGPFGIVASMWMHKRFLGKAKARKEAAGNVASTAGHDLRTKMRLSFITAGHLTRTEAIQATGMMLFLMFLGLAIGFAWAIR